MLSRVADSLYWMSRYLERAEHTSRLLRVRLDTMVEESDEAASNSWLRLAGALRARLPDGKPDAAAITQHLAFDRVNRSSVFSAVQGARDNARQVREQISSEVWEGLNRQYLQLIEADFDSVWVGSRQPSFEIWSRGFTCSRAFHTARCGTAKVGAFSNWAATSSALSR
jgi:uncharacterized alpha-E superfamily protein